MTVVTTVSRAQLALGLQVLGEDGDDEVAVHQLAGGVDGEHAVAVAVEGEAEVEAVGGARPPAARRCACCRSRR